MTPVMSFWPSIYAQIEGQIKLIEYRRNFPDNCSFAYMYITKPVNSISGIVYFGKKHLIADWREEYKNDSEVMARIDTFNTSPRYGMEISGFQKTLPISLDDLRKNVPNFTPPQSYVLLENNKTLSDFIENNLVTIGEKINNDLSNIFPEHVCKRY